LFEKWYLANLNDIMTRRGVTKSKLADLLGVEVSTISLKMGVRYGSFTDTQKEMVARFLDCEDKKEWLFEPFKVEPIKWKVLTNSYNDETNLCLLLTTEILTANVPFHIKQGDRSIGAKTIYQNNYKYSTIRAYLNGKYENTDNQTDYTTQNYRNNGFLQTAFPSSVISNINNTLVNNGRESAGYSENSDDEDSDCILPFICDNTTDKIFLLSTSEVGNSGYGFTDEDAKIRFITDYAKANFAYQNPKEFENKQHAGNWWLRSPCCCNYSGDGKYIGETNIANCIEYHRIFHHTHESNIGIVPALTISLPESF